MLDPQAKAVLEFATAGAPLNERGVDGARAWSAEMAAPPEGPDPRLAIEDREVSGVPVRMYRPAAHTGDLPVVMFIHGGGWVLGNLDSADFVCRRLCLASELAVVSIDYRLSPEAIFPEPLEDCITVLRWIVEDGRAVGLDPGAVCVAGESSGGQLAAATCLRAAELGMPVALQLLVCPVIDPGMDSPSWREFGAEYLPVSSQMSWMWDLYAGSAETRAGEPLVNLTLERDLSRLPATIVITAEYDALRDEAEEYGRRLEEAGVATEVRRLAGQIHAVFGFSAAVDACRAALEETSRDLNTRLTSTAIGGKTA